MQGILRAIANALASAVRTVVEWCVRPSRYVTRMVFGGSASAPVIEEPPAPRQDFRLPDVERTKKIKRLAVAMDGPDVDAGLFMGVADPVVTWLGAMDKSMRGLVAGASAIQLEDHMKGRKSIRGLLAYDRASVEAWKSVGGDGSGGGRGRLKPLRQAAEAGFSKMSR